MRFSDPNWLWAGLLACVALVLLWRRFDVRQKAALASFIAPHLHGKLTGSVSGLRRVIQRGLFLLSVIGLFGALAGPELGFHWEKISRRGNEVVFAIDTSRSMLTPDVKPNRLTRAKLAIDDMARQLDGDGIGIVAFAGNAFLVCPLTLDYAAFQQSLDAVDVNTIPLGGTNISSAIAAARDALRRRPGSDKILILVTDGENLQGDVLSAAQEAAKQDGLKIYTVGIGTADGELIPLPGDLGGGYVRDEAGELVKSHLDESGLKAIAAATGGAYVHLVGQGEDFEAFLRTVFGAVSKHDLVYRQQKIYTQRYQWPLAAALICLLASMMVGTRRAGRPRAVAATPVGAVLTMLVVLGAPVRSKGADQTNTIAGARPGATAQSPAGTARSAGTAPPAAAPHRPTGASPAAITSPPAGASPLAPRTSSVPRSPLAAYNAGTSAYRAGQFAQATQAFQSSINASPASDARRLADQQDAYYNLGNALYRAGQQEEKSAPQNAIAKWTDAVKAYETALQLRPGDADSKFNRDFVKRKIDALQRPPSGGSGGGSGSGSSDGGGGSGSGGGGSGSGGGGDSGGGAQPPQQPQGQQPQQPPPQPNPSQPPAQQTTQGQPPSSQPPNQAPPPSQGQQPPQTHRLGQGQPPSAPPPQGQPPQPAAPGQSPGQPPQQPPQGQSAQQPPPQGAGTNSPSGDPADNSGAPGQMSVEEANDLLNSAKSDEHHSLLVPSGPRPPDLSPDKPFKNW